MKRFLMAIALVWVLCVPVIAGEIPTSGFVPPQPGPTETTNASGEIPTSGVVQQLSDDVTMAVLLTVFGMFAT